MKSLKEYMTNEDSVDSMKQAKLNDMFLALERLNDEYDELEQMDREETSSGVGDLTDQLTTMGKLISGLYAVLDRSSKIVPMESVNEEVIKIRAVKDKEDLKLPTTGINRKFDGPDAKEHAATAKKQFEKDGYHVVYETESKEPTGSNPNMEGSRMGNMHIQNLRKNAGLDYDPVN